MNRELIVPHYLTLNFIKDNFIEHQGTVYRIDGYIGSLNRDKYRQFKFRLSWERAKLITVLAHHISWWLNKQEWPSDLIDHEDRNKENNSVSNLRYLSNSGHKANVDTKHGLPIGVKKKKSGYYEAYITFNGKKIFCGSRRSAEEAHACYCEMYFELYGIQFDL